MGTIAANDIGTSRTTMGKGKKVFPFNRKALGQQQEPAALCSVEHGDRYVTTGEVRRLGYPPLSPTKKGGIGVGAKAQSLFRRFRRQESQMSSSLYPVVARMKEGHRSGSHLSQPDPCASSIDTEDSDNICGHPIHDSAEIMEARQQFSTLMNRLKTSDPQEPDWCVSASSDGETERDSPPTEDVDDLQAGPRIEEARIGHEEPITLAIPPTSGNVPEELEIVMEQRVGSYFLAANWLPTLTQSSESSGILTMPEDDNSLEYSYEEPDSNNGCCLLPDVDQLVDPYFHNYL